MKSTPLISVLIPLYNCSNYIESSIFSILNQSYDNVEVIIVNDGSTDESEQIVKNIQDNRIRYYKNKANIGYNQTMNRLFDLANGDFIAMQDADDISLPQRFEKQLKAFESQPELAVVGTNVINMDQEGNEIERTAWPMDINSLMLVPKFEIKQNSFMVRSEAQKIIGGFHKVFDRVGYDDFYWAYRCAERFKMINLEEHLYMYRYNPNSMMRTMKKRNVEYGYQLLIDLIDQRKQTGCDDLENNQVHRLVRKSYNQLVLKKINANDLRAATYYNNQLFGKILTSPDYWLKCIHNYVKITTRKLVSG